MLAKTFELAGIGAVRIIKKRGNRNIRLSFDASGQPRISVPQYAPYHVGLAFARQKASWINQHRPLVPLALADGQIIARYYTLAFRASASVKSASARVKASRIIVTYPAALTIASDAVQKAAKRGADKAIKLEAEKVLPPRLAELALVYGYEFKSVKIKPMRRRWGSCDQAGNITLNQFLVTLAPELIDYVLLHELVHTKHQHHQADFWSTMEHHLPDVKALRKRARSAQPGLALAD